MAASSSYSASKSSKLTLFLLPIILFSLLVLNFYAIPTFALNIGIELNPGLKVEKECSRTCESKYCGLPPFLRYGKYCGVLYSGCPGEVPCDGLDACCMEHDNCIQKRDDYLSQSCNEKFLKCVNNFQKRRGRTFKGNTCSIDEVVGVFTKVMDAAIIAGKIFHKP